MDLIASKAPVIILIVILVISMGVGEVMCGLSDTEVSTGNHASGWIPFSWRQTSAADFEEGITDNTDIVSSPGNVLLSTIGLGTFTSAVLDTGKAGSLFDSAFWNRSLPGSTTLMLEVRASDGLSLGEPDSSWSSLGGGTSASLDGLTGQYVQWRATFTSSEPGDTPVLEEVRIYYRLA